MSTKVQYSASQKLLNNLQQVIVKYEGTLSDTISIQATDIVRDTDWSRSLIEILQKEFDYYQNGIKYNPSLEFINRQHFAHVVQSVADTASMYSLPIDTQLESLDNYLQNSIKNDEDIKIDMIKQNLVMP